MLKLMRNKYIVVLIVSIVFIIFWIYKPIETTRITVGTIESKESKGGNHFINIIYADQTRTDKIKVPLTTWNLIKADIEYFFVYKFNLIRKPYLVDIREH